MTQNAWSPMLVRRGLWMSSLAEAEDRTLVRDSKAANITTHFAAVLADYLQIF